MRIAKSLLVYSTLILIFISIPLVYSQTIEDQPPNWNLSWEFRQEINIPIQTNESHAKYQPIDLQINFDNPCWTKNETDTSIRICVWDGNKWHELESQIYDLSVSDINYIQSCSIVFLIPNFADGTERYFVYYDDSEKSSPNYKNHVDVKDLYYHITPMSDVTAEAKYYGIKEEGICICGIGQEGTLLDRSFSNIVITQKEEKEEFDLLNMDQIVSFAFSYYYGENEKDESSSDQSFIYKEIFVDGNLMVEFGIISESKMKDIRTTAIYKYYYSPLEEKRICVKVKHDIKEDILVKGKENLDGRFGAFVSFKSRNPVIKRMNFGEIYPYLYFHSEKNIVESYQMIINPESKNREWILSYKDDADLGSEAWVAYGDDATGKVNSLIFSSNKDFVKSGTDENDGIQFKVTEKEYFNFLSTEVDYASINFGRNSYEKGQTHDLKIPKDLIVEFEAEIFTSDTGGYAAVQREAKIYQKLVSFRGSSEDSSFETETKKHDLKIINHFGGTRFSYPWLAANTDFNFPVMWIELYDNENVIASGVANRSFLQRGRANILFKDIPEGEYLIKVYWKIDNKTMFFRGAKTILLDKDSKIHIFCTWERSLELIFSDQNGLKIEGIYAVLLNKDGWIFDKNSTNFDGSVILKAPYNLKNPYILKAYYRDFLIYDGEVKNTLRDIIIDFDIELYDLTVKVKDILGLSPGVLINPILSTAKSDDNLEILSKEIKPGEYLFENIPSDQYIIQISYAGFIDEIYINIPQDENFVIMDFSANFEIIIDILDRRGNLLSYDDVYFEIERDGKKVYESSNNKFYLPPSSYKIKAYADGKFVGSKDVDLTNNRKINLVTSFESMTPTLVVFFAFSIIIFLIVVTYLKRIDLGSFLKLLAIILIIVALVQPWWYLSGSSNNPVANRDVQMYIIPQVMIESTSFEGNIIYDIAEMPDIFINLLGTVVIIAYFACIMLCFSFLSKLYFKKRYSLILGLAGVLIILGIISSAYIGISKLCELSIGDVSGKGIIDVLIGVEKISMQSNWGFSYGFYLILSAFFISLVAFLFELKKTLKVVKIF